jgi:YYY domain-containing protein
MMEQSENAAEKHRFDWARVVLVLALVLTLTAGAYLRLTGVNWDENQHMHPDERHISLVLSAIAPVEEAGEYFNTETSSLNPANRGYGFYVYGTLPLFLVRYVAEAVGQVGYDAFAIVGRYISAIFDLITVLLVFAVGRRLYNRWVGLLGALFYALAVLPIQLSHYATVDAVTNTFAFLAVYAAVWALTRPDLAEPSATEKKTIGAVLWELAPYLLFGVALGAATASKINAVALALVLILVEFSRMMRQPEPARQKASLIGLRNLVVAGIVSFLVFRIGQPYAFNGPGFLNMGINQGWWASLQSLRAQASGQVDFPPALQWARRPLTFSLENLVRWGLGLPLGITAWAAYLGMGWSILRKRDWQRHLPLWGFTGIYFVWQSISWVRSMRYQMLIYPALALFAGWGLVKLWTVRKEIRIWFLRLRPKLIRIAGIILTVIVVITTAVWAYAFSRIYTQPQPRAQASRWIYQNIPGALTLEVQTEQGGSLQPLPYRAGDTLTPEAPLALPFYAEADGLVTSVTLPHILDTAGLATTKQVGLSITSADDRETALANISIADEFIAAENDWRGAAYTFFLDPAVHLEQDQLYYLELDLEIGESSLFLNGSPTLSMLSDEGMSLTQPLRQILQSVRAEAPYAMQVRLTWTGEVTEVQAPYLVDLMGASGAKDLTLELSIMGDEEGLSRSATLRDSFAPAGDARGGAYTFVLDEPLPVRTGQDLYLTLFTETEAVRLVPHAPAPAHESSWDDAVPYPVDGFSPYSPSGGIYRGDLNFEMYWADNDVKLEKFETNLDLADYIFITSSRQWGTTTRVPERYPLTTYYYRNLLGCPEDTDIEWCYSMAEPGTFEGNLGFELVATFQSNPSIGSFEINDQASEEAFTVYDHPKVLIFRKTDAYDPVEVRELLRTVDLSKVVYFTPGDAADYKGPSLADPNDPQANLMLPEDRLAEQRENGTWSELFNRESPLNTSQPLAVIALYLLVTLLGCLAYPLIRLALPGLADRGYPLAKLAGLMLLAFFVWILGSLGISFTRPTILWVLLGLLIASLVFIVLQRKDLREELRSNWRYIITVEALALVAFLVFIFIRLGNPDLWHPYKGGEKPMDFSYLNAVLKSTTFPPYDPWFAGGYINYYYYGFVILGVPIKLLGITPSVAYNIVLPIWYSLLVLSAFSIGWNLYTGIPRSRALRAGEPRRKRLLGWAFAAAVMTVLGVAVLGNLGTVRMILVGFQRIASGGAPVDTAGLAQKIAWTVQGFVQRLQGVPMPFYPGDWYWNPSRVIPGDVITEFPFFSFIYADLHAHLLAFPITLFALSWSLSVVLNKARWGEPDGRFKWLGTVMGFLLGGLVIGALRPTNTWDFYTYTVFASIALFYSLLRHYRPRLKLDFKNSELVERLVAAVLGVLLLVGLSILLYQPFAHWYGQGYNTIRIWEGDRTPLGSYLTHWGLFLFVIVSWMAWETYHWMKTTPQSALERLAPYKIWFTAAAIVVGIVLVACLASGITIALVALPIAVWSVVLMFRPGRSEGRRFVLFLIGTATFLTLVVEIIYLPGDIGRMNTVFKFYLQAWIMFAVAAGVCLSWAIQSLRYWRRGLSLAWQVVCITLVFSTALFPILGTTDKISDRMATDAPHTLDGMAYMPYATYNYAGQEMLLEEDYHAIQWLQDNAQGSPVIVEGQAYEYLWGSRYTIYTGLPGVVGWNWHQRQQRAILQSNIVQERVDAVGTFYFTEDREVAEDFLEEYDVQYIIYGQLERIFFPGEGLYKFEKYNGVLWQEVYRYGSTVIYEVMD